MLDGLVNPPTNSICKDGNIYTFTTNFYGQLIVETDDVVIDGAGYILHGQYAGNRTNSWVVGQGPDQNTTFIIII